MLIQEFHVGSNKDGTMPVDATVEVAGNGVRDFVDDDASGYGAIDLELQFHPAARAQRIFAWIHLHYSWRILEAFLGPEVIHDGLDVFEGDRAAVHYMDVPVLPRIASTLLVVSDLAH